MNGESKIFRQILVNEWWGNDPMSLSGTGLVSPAFQHLSTTQKLSSRCQQVQDLWAHACNTGLTMWARSAVLNKTLTFLVKSGPVLFPSIFPSPNHMPTWQMLAEKVVDLKKRETWVVAEESSLFIFWLTQQSNHSIIILTTNKSVKLLIFKTIYVYTSN